jgi:hypothetical protein
MDASHVFYFCFGMGFMSTISLVLFVLSWLAGGAC